LIEAFARRHGDSFAQYRLDIRMVLLLIKQFPEKQSERITLALSLHVV